MPSAARGLAEVGSFIHFVCPKHQRQPKDQEEKEQDEKDCARWCGHVGTDYANEADQDHEQGGCTQLPKHSRIRVGGTEDTGAVGQQIAAAEKIIGVQQTVLAVVLHVHGQPQ